MPTMMETEFREMTGVAQKSNETRQNYLERVYEKVRDLSDDDWERLTAKAQNWFNDAGKAGEDQDLPDFPDVEPGRAPNKADKEAGKKESEDTMATATAKKKKAAVSAKSATKRKTATNGHAKREKGALRESGTAVMKRALLRNPNLDDKALMKICKDAGFKLSPFSIAARKADFLHTVKLLQTDGKLKA